MTNLEISFPNSDIGKLSEIFIDSFVFKCSIDSLYSSAKVILKDFCNQYFNSIKIGMEVEVVLKERPTDDCTEGIDKFTNKMRIYSFDKIPGQQSILSNRIEITLVSSWYFLNKISSKIHSGSVGEILSNMSNALKIEGSNFDIGDFHSTTSDPSRRRYQLSEKSQDFMKKILKYGYVGSIDASNKLTSAYPLYLYMDAKNRLNLRSLGDFLNNSVKYTLIPDATELEYNKVNLDKTVGLQAVRLRNYKVLSSNEPTTSRKVTYFTTAGFSSTSSFQVKSRMSNAENNNPSSSQISPEEVGYKLWDYTPQDAFATSIREYCESNLDVFSLVGTLDGFDLHAGSIGNLVKVSLPGENSNGETSTISDGGYIIKTAEYIYQNNLPITRVQMFLARYSSVV